MWMQSHQDIGLWCPLSLTRDPTGALEGGILRRGRRPAPYRCLVILGPQHKLGLPGIHVRAIQCMFSAIAWSTSSACPGPTS